MSNKNLNHAKSAKNDEFYTFYEDIEKELQHYTKHFKNKTIYCNCDNPYNSNFYKYFINNFERFGLKKLIATNCGNPSFKAINGQIMQFEGGGDFRSSQSIELLKESDIVVTNPPFSIAREHFLPLLFQYKKKFIVVGDLNWVAYQNVFPYFQRNEIWFGISRIGEFIRPDGTRKKFGNKCWFTNLEHEKRTQTIPLTKSYNEKLYDKFDTYNAININRVEDIPKDYDGVMGVPISFLQHYNQLQFSLIGTMYTHRKSAINFGYPYVNGKKKFTRILIKKI